MIASGADTAPVDAGAPAAAQDAGPVRTCVGCRRKAPRSELVRWVLVDGVPERDERKVLPGRGAWLHDDPECEQVAVRRRALARALRAAR